MSVAEAAAREFFAACPRHVPELLAAELRALGIEVTRTHPAGVSFQGPLEHALKACLHSRTASRVVLSLATGPAEDPEQFYALVHALPWEEHVEADGTIAVDVVGDAPGWVRRTTFAAQKAKDAIVDRFRARAGARPSVDLERPDLRISVRFGRGAATIGIDLAGEPFLFPAPAAIAIDAEVPADPRQPGVEAGAAIECGQRPEQLDEDLLGQVLGLVDLRDELVGDVEDPLPVDPDERVPRRRISLETALDEVCL